jgi:hypothetical protein
MNNIPASLMLEQTWTGTDLAARLAALDARFPEMFTDACLFAANFGANLTVHGALAGLVWLRIIHGFPALGTGTDAPIRVPTARGFAAFGVLLVPLVTAVTCVAIGLVGGTTP